MKHILPGFLLAISIGFAGCGSPTDLNLTQRGTNSTSENMTARTVEAACGQCQFDMKGRGCDLAIRIGKETFWVDGTGIDDHGDAHGHDGLCNCVREAVVTGQVKNGRFSTTSFELKTKDSTANECK